MKESAQKDIRIRTPRPGQALALAGAPGFSCKGFLLFSYTGLVIWGSRQNSVRSRAPGPGPGLGPDPGPGPGLGPEHRTLRGVCYPAPGGAFRNPE